MYSVWSTKPWVSGSLNWFFDGGGWFVVVFVCFGFSLYIYIFLNEDCKSHGNDGPDDKKRRNRAQT